jgi:iron complex transport system permease protein
MSEPRYLTRARFTRVIVVLALCTVLAVFLSAAIGPVRVDLWNALFGPSAQNVDAMILFRARLPRALLAAVVGGALAVAGATLQAILRNPLAEPHLIGVSGGAALGGVVTMVVVGAGNVGGFSPIPLGAFLGALGATVLVYRLGTVGGRLEPYTFLLAGVVCNAFAGALIMFVNTLADLLQAHGILFWLMGSLATHSYGQVAASALYLALAVAWLLPRARTFNALSLGEEGAQQLGVDVQRTRQIAFVVSSFLVGAAVAVSGMIGFVGLIVPHVARLVLGPDYRLLLPASVLLGGIFLVAADTLARTAMGGTELPVGVVTALCGAPFFLYLLRREGGKTFGS